jgi:fatty-acyl-CoA synthase
VATIAEWIRARAEDDGTALLFEDSRWSWRELAGEAAARAALLRAAGPIDPPHVGVLLENVPDFVFWLAAAALSRSVVVGINPTRRGAELARDIRATDCRFLATDRQHRGLLDGLELGIPEERILVIDDERGAARLAAQRGAPPPAEIAEPSDLFVLFFTSGTTGTPKAVRCGQGRLASAGAHLAAGFGIAGGVVYQAMPMFHSNALMAGWAPALAAGAPMALRRRFSASGWLPDVRRYAATYFNYVGKPLAYILATPERPDDADNPLRTGFGNEANQSDLAAFEKRFGCRVVDSYGSSEGGANVGRTPETPPNALGRVSEDVRVLDPETRAECPPARFDAQGRLLNAELAIGQIASRSGLRAFEGYYKNPEAEAERVHDGWYWSGDLAYRDEQGFLYFAGRGHDWLRVDGENFAAAPVEAILLRHPDVMLAAVYAVPDPRVGDQVMACVQLRPGAGDVANLDAFVRSQPDLGTKQLPRFLRVTPAMPVTETSKVQKRLLRAQRWDCADPVFWREDPRGPLVPLGDGDRARIRRDFDANGRGHVLALGA